MSQYGQMIGGGRNLESYNVYNFFVYYFNNPIMMKVKTVGNQYVYACKIQSLLAKDKRYIIAVVDINRAPVKDEVPLDQIEWYTLQTRVLDECYTTRTHVYLDKTDEVSLSQIIVKEKTDVMYTYTSIKFPTLKTYLLYGKNQTRAFSDKGPIKTAIEMYSTIFSM